MERGGSGFLAQAAGVPISTACARLAVAQGSRTFQQVVRLRLYVDYAHTPQAVKKIITAVREEHAGSR